MEQAFRGADWGAVAFWLFVAACVVAGAWEKIRRNAEKHATLRTIIDKTGVVDEAKLKELFSPPPSSVTASAPGAGYRVLRILGTVIMGIAAAIAVFSVAMRLFSEDPQASMQSNIGLILSTTIATFGAALFFSSRFAQSPPEGNGPTAR